jgi:1,4-dihydroxy-2-naphthoate polyprenyltransferase
VNRALEIPYINTLKLLRFPFSFFLLPVSLFSLYFTSGAEPGTVILILSIWHLLVFPSSNGYNSFHDRDTGPVGGLAHPPLPSRILLLTCNTMDILAIVSALCVNIMFALFVSGYIVASRLYSNRSVRLKKFPLAGFFIVFIFQGAWIFIANTLALSGYEFLFNAQVLTAAVASSFLIGALYPVSQIYQHESDKRDGVKSLSMLLGKKGTFVFTAVFFVVASLLIHLSLFDGGYFFSVLLLILLSPAVLFFLNWAVKSFQEERHINFRNTMIMLVLSSVMINIYFLILLIQ